MAVRASVLEQQLNGERSRATPLRVLEDAARQVEIEGRLNMGALATRAGVSRATLHRWVGNREQLLGEVFAIGSQRLFAQASSEARSSGAEKVLETLARFLVLVDEHHAVRALRRDDPELALRVFTTTATNTRTQDAIEGLLTHERDAGRLALTRFTPRDLALVLLRAIHAFVFRELFIDEPPALELANITARSLLHAATQ